MARHFCLCCGEPIDPPKACACGLPNPTRQQLERREQEHLAAYQRARLLGVDDLKRIIASGGSTLTVQELLRNLEHPDEVFKELAMRATERGVVQLIYEKKRGTQLLFWPWA